jgi:hypothetical protein
MALVVPVPVPFPNNAIDLAYYTGLHTLTDEEKLRFDDTFNMQANDRMDDGMRLFVKQFRFSWQRWNFPVPMSIRERQWYRLDYHFWHTAGALLNIRALISMAKERFLPDEIMREVGSFIIVPKAAYFERFCEPIFLESSDTRPRDDRGLVCTKQQALDAGLCLLCGGSIELCACHPDTEDDQADVPTDTEDTEDDSIELPVANGPGSPGFFDDPMLGYELEV